MFGSLHLAAAVTASLLAATAAARELTPRERAGKRIFAEGIGAAGRELHAAIAGTSVSAASVTCAGCHGPDGRGRAEGGVAAPAIVWSELAKRYGHVHDGGRTHPAFDARSVVRAVTAGIDPAGNPLDPAMPRYALSREDAQRLVAYLRVLETDRDPGVSPATLRVATVLPTGGPLAPAGAAMRAVLEASFARVNAGGGLHGRRLALAVAGYDGDPAGAIEALRRLVEREPPFALVAGLAPGAEDALAELAEREKLPLVAPFGGAPASAGTGRYAFYALAGLRDEARVLARWAGRERAARTSRIAVVHARDPALADAARAAAGELAGGGFQGVDVVPFDAAGAGDLPERLEADGVERVLFLGPDDALRAFTARANALGFAPMVFAPGALVARAAAAAPRSFDERIFLAYPARPGGESPGALEPLERLRREAHLPDRHPAAQAAAYTAATVLEEALRRAGRALTRERLVESLEGLFRFDTGLVPPLTFGPARRVGAPGGYVVAVDIGRRAFTPASGWIALE